jgi:hypothetical protein
MLLYLGLSLLLLTAVLCLGLSRLLPTRWLGGFAALVSLLTALLVLFLSLPPAPELVWLNLGDLSLLISGNGQGAAIWLVAVLSGSAAILLAALATAIAATVRGFGSLFAWSLLALAAGWLGIGTSGLFAAVAWGLISLCAYAAIRASGTVHEADQMPGGLLLGLSGALLLLLGMLAARPALNAGLPPTGAVLAAVLPATLMFSGSAPFLGRSGQSSQSPAALGALFYGLLFPLVGLSTLNTFLAELPLIPPFWRPILLGTGALGALVSAVAALGEPRLRRRLSRLVAFQVGIALATLGLPEASGQLAFQASVSNLALSSSLAALAIGILERSSGNDDFTGRPGGGSRMAGLAWLIAALAALGLPPFWGFWSRIWLLAALTEQQGWAAALLLAATVPAMVAFLLPMARFWGQAGLRYDAPHHTANRGEGFLVILATAALLLTGIWPALAPELGLLAPAIADVPAAAGPQIVSISCAAAGLLLFGLLANRRQAGRLSAESELEPAILDANALAHSLKGSAEPGWPERLSGATGNGLLRLSSWMQQVIGVFEGRYYLAGVLMGLILLLVLMAQ